MNQHATSDLRRRLGLAEIILTPLRMTLDEMPLDRLATLAVRVDELIESGYTTNEIRRHLVKVDAANEGDGY